MIFGIELNYAIIVVITIIVTLSGVSIFNIIRSSTKFSLDKISPILIDAITEAEKIFTSFKEGKEAFSAYIIEYIKQEIETSNQFTSFEKVFLNKERIAFVIQPIIDKLWEKKI